MIEEVDPAWTTGSSSLAKPLRVCNSVCITKDAEFLTVCITKDAEFLTVSICLKHETHASQSSVICVCVGVGVTYQRDRRNGSPFNRNLTHSR